MQVRYSQRMPTISHISNPIFNIHEERDKVAEACAGGSTNSAVRAIVSDFPSFGRLAHAGTLRRIQKKHPSRVLDCGGCGGGVVVVFLVIGFVQRA